MATRNKYNVIGVATSGTSIQHRKGSTDALTEDLCAQDALRWIVTWELDRSNLVHSQGDQFAPNAVSPQDYSTVKTWLNQGRSWYHENGIAKGKIYVDWYLNQRTNESDPDFDFFAVRSRYEIIPGALLDSRSTWINRSVKIRYDLPFDVDEMDSWDPHSQSDTRTFNVSLPLLPISWSFQTNGKHVVKTSASLVDDWAQFHFDNSFPHTMDNPLLVKPGFAWTSSGTYAGIDTHHEIEFVGHMGARITETWDEELRHDY